MSLHNPEELEFDRDLFERLSPRDLDFLVRFYNLHRNKLENDKKISRSTHTADELRKIIAAKLDAELEEFLNTYNELTEEGVRTDPATEFLAEHYDISNEELDIDDRYDLFLLIYQQELEDTLQELVARSRMQSQPANRTYIVEDSLGLDSLDERVDQFHQEWNNSSENSPILVRKEYQDQNIAVLKLYQETGPKYPKTFAFRKEQTDEEDEVPIEPELTAVEYYQLKTVRIQVESRDEESEIVFSDPVKRKWRQTLPDFFETVFGLSDVFDEISNIESEVATDIEQSMTEAIERGGDPIQSAREDIESRRQEAEDEIEEKDLPESMKQELKDSIESIEISGSEITDDQSIQTQEFRLIAGLEGLFSSVDIEEGFKDMLEKADSDKQSFVLRINDRPVELDDGTWSKMGAGRLPDRDRRALQIFFDAEIEL